MERKKVLIIDDETDLCLLLKSYFLKKEYNVFVSHRLDEGLLALDQEQPDILFLDNNLPDGTGWNLAPAIAQKYPQLQINLISAYHPEPEPLDGHRVKIIEKPISFNDLDQIFT
jgi:DNA-binding response OmpR family regulator